MAKVTVTIRDNDLAEVAAAAEATGLSVSAFMAKAATSAAMAEARRRYDLYLAESPQDAELINAARARALRRGKAARLRSAERHQRDAA